MHEVNFNDVVTANYTVWGSSSVKLSLEANYIRFYAPKLLKEETEMFLYFDSDTLFVNGGLDQLFSTPLLTPKFCLRLHSWSHQTLLRFPPQELHFP